MFNASKVISVSEELATTRKRTRRKKQGYLLFRLEIGGLGEVTKRPARYISWAGSHRSLACWLAGLHRYHTAYGRFASSGGG